MDCVMCLVHAEEDIEHLFFHCSFARRCWHDRILHARSVSRLPFFMEICIIAMWELWKLRNRKIFDGQAASFGLWLLRFKEEIRLQSLRLKEALKPAISSWVDSL
ncbi:hypothetical protein BS78_03G051100 [Paspalum vaginatum]|nr:hypothetical protein BS78_03G051100 [Paspalum vaginatum]